MSPDPDSILTTVLQLVNDMTRDWGIEQADVGPDTRLTSDLLFSSVDVIHLLGTVEMTYRQKFPYDRLVTDDSGKYRDISIGDLTAFITTHFDHADAGPMAMR